MTRALFIDGQKVTVTLSETARLSAPGLRRVLERHVIEAIERLAPGIVTNN